MSSSPPPIYLATVAELPADSSVVWQLIEAALEEHFDIAMQRLQPPYPEVDGRTYAHAVDDDDTEEWPLPPWVSSGFAFTIDLADGSVTWDDPPLIVEQAAAAAYITEWLNHDEET